MTLHTQLERLMQSGKEQAKDASFMAIVVLAFMELHMNMSLNGNGWFDDDEVTAEAVYTEDVKTFIDEALRVEERTAQGDLF